MLHDVRVDLTVVDRHVDNDAVGEVDRLDRVALVLEDGADALIEHLQVGAGVESDLDRGLVGGGRRVGRLRSSAGASGGGQREREDGCGDG